MPSITSTWNSDVSANWGVGTAWAPSGVPDAANADVLINAAGAYTVTIAGNESYQVDSVTLNGADAVLSIAGTLDFTGSGKTLRTTAGTMTLNGGTIADATAFTGLVGGKGTILGAGILGNQGTLIANAGTNQDLFILQSFSNTGTVIANNGFLGIEGSSLTNLSGNTLTDGAVTSGGSVTVAAGDALTLSGGSIGTLVNSGTVFGAGGVLTVKTASGAGTTSTNGMPIETSMTNSVTTTTLSATTLSNIMTDFSVAAANWGQYITSDLPLRVSLILSDSASGAELAQGGPYNVIPTGGTLDGRRVYEPDGMDAMTTGSYYPTLPFDIVVTLDANTTNLSNFYINPNPTVRTANVTLTGANRLKYDLESVFIHEIGHGLGIAGLMQQTGSFSGGSETMYDHYVQTVTTNGTVSSANFVGPNAKAAYGAELGTNISTPVPLTFLDNGENLYHLANKTTDFLDSDVMNGVGLSVGTAYAVSAVDLGIMADIGVPVTSGLVCYAQGTRIATPRGDIPIEQLAIGDAVLTSAGEAKPIVWIGQRRIDCRRHANPLVAEPIRIARDAFGDDQPRRDLLVSPQHGLLVDGVLIPARLLVNGASIRRERGAGMVTYYHIELPRHAILLAEGLPAESYLDTGNRALFDNGGEVLALHPDFAAITPERAWTELACAPLVEDEPTVRPVRQRLADRAVALGFALPDPAITEDAGLTLVIDDKAVRPILQERLRHVFVLPPGARVARIRSRSAQPCALYPWVEDMRRLGVQVQGIRFHTVSDRRDVPVDHPALSEGWWAPERNGAALWRWTDGDA
ncbi:MAG TPA: Hint domain-containing protein, partial [Acetobacteraceae bacterium]|nr:Hint domain-containing protein [Acetobacteraceae bacterium]